MIGDSVNLASRLEGLTRTYGTDILLGPTATEFVRDEFHVRSVARVQVKGKTEPVEIATLLGARDDKTLDRRSAAPSSRPTSRPSRNSGSANSAKRKSSSRSSWSFTLTTTWRRCISSARWNTKRRRRTKPGMRWRFSKRSDKQGAVCRNFRSRWKMPRATHELTRGENHDRPRAR